MKGRKRKRTLIAIIFSLGIILSLTLPSRAEKKEGVADMLLARLKNFGWRVLYYRSPDTELWGNRGYVYINPKLKAKKAPPPQVAKQPVIPPPSPKLLEEKELEKLKVDLEKTLAQVELEKRKREELEQYLEQVKKQLEAYKQKINLKEVKTHRVKKGECLWYIAGYPEVYGDPLKWPLIYRANRDKIKDPNLIYPGQVFIIPQPEEALKEEELK